MPIPPRGLCSRHHLTTCETLAAITFSSLALIVYCFRCFDQFSAQWLWFGERPWSGSLTLSRSEEFVPLILGQSLSVGLTHASISCRYLRNLPSTFKEADLSQLFAPFDGVKVTSQPLLPTVHGILLQICTTQRLASAGRFKLDVRFSHIAYHISCVAALLEDPLASYTQNFTA